MTVGKPQAETDSVHLVVGGMHCANCARAVERSLLKTPGVVAAHVSYALGRAQVLYEPGRCTQELLLTAVRNAGYSASRDITADLLEGPVSPGRLALIAALTVLLMGLSHGGLHLLWSAVALAVFLQVFAGGPFYRGAYHALRGGTTTMDVLVALGISAAFGGALLDIARGRPMPMLDSAPLLATIILVGKSLEARVRRQATRALSELAGLSVGQAHRIGPEGREADVPLAQIAEGDLLVIRPGERVPADGLIEDGRSAVDESLVTGESVPVPRGPGDAIVGGATNGQGLLRIRATAVGQASFLARVLAMVQEAQLERPPIQQLADRIAAIFVPAVVALAIATAVLWRFVLAGRYLPVSVDAGSFALDATIGVLVIACPCALGLATPLAVLAGASLAMGHGILVRRASALETAARTREVVLDKTGTLTWATPQLEIVKMAGPGTPAQTGSPGDAERSALTIAAAAVGGSSHPLARAIVAAAGERGDALSPPQATEMSETPGMGVSATVAGRRVVCGRIDFLAQQGLEAQPLLVLAEPMLAQGLSIMALSVDGQPVAVMGLRAPVRREARECVVRLASLGLTTRLLTGDREPVARAIAGQLGIAQVDSEVAPEGKRDRIAGLVRSGQVVAMVGDGINDAPAMAAASLGIAVGSASELAKEAGDVVLVSADLRAIPAFFRIGRATLATIHQNFALAVAYNLVALPVAAGALYPWTGRMLPPEACAGLMALSSLTVVANSLRLRAMRL